MISVAQLIHCGIAPTQAKTFVDPLNQFLPIYAITSRVRMAAFIAQCAHESGNFANLEESLFYRTPERIRAMWPTRVPTLAEAAKLCKAPQALANRVYSNRNGNGDEASGDGWRFRGRGLIQVTGRANYKAVGYDQKADQVAQPLGAVQTACIYWQNNGLNALADASNIDEITRKVNGPRMVGATERRENFREALAALGASA